MSRGRGKLTSNGSNSFVEVNSLVSQVVDCLCQEIVDQKWAICSDDYSAVIAMIDSFAWKLPSV